MYYPYNYNNDVDIEEHSDETNYRASFDTYRNVDKKDDGIHRNKEQTIEMLDTTENVLAQPYQPRHQTKTNPTKTLTLKKAQGEQNRKNKMSKAPKKSKMTKATERVAEFVGYYTAIGMRVTGGNRGNHPAGT